jgi:hypothetical protein
MILFIFTVERELFLLLLLFAHDKKKKGQTFGKCVI